MKGAGHAIRGLYVLIAIIFIYLPVGTLILFAFQSSAVPVPPFDGPSLRWFDEVLSDPRMMQALGNSLVVGLSSALISTVFGTLAAYGIARHGGAWTRHLQGALMLPLTISYVIIGMGLLVTLNRLQMPKSLAAVIIGHAVINMPVVIALVSSQMSQGMVRLEQAARDLGAREWQVLWHVVLPGLAWSFAAGFLLCFTLSWDEFIIALLLSRFDVTLPVEIWGQLRSGLNPRTNAIGALVFMASAVIVIAVEWILLARFGRRARD